MKRFFPLFLILSILVPAALWLSSWILELKHYESTDDAYLKANSVLISPKVSGYVTQLLINDNQAVKKGELLVVIENRDYQAKVLQAEASIEEAQAYKKRLQAMKSSQQAHTAAAQANIAAAQARLDTIII
jgi:membrane fusion protein (multidrug efflux system)